VGSIQFKCNKEQIKAITPDQTFVITLMANAQNADPVWMIDEMKFTNLEDAIRWINLKSNMIGF